MKQYDLISRDTVRLLMEGDDVPRVSIYMPTHAVGRETQQDPIRLRNLVNTAEQKLKEGGWRWDECEKILKPAKDLIGNADFWLHQADGLAMFLSLQQSSIFRLPITFDEKVFVNEHFQLKPLLPLLTHDATYYLLAISDKQVKLYQGTRYTLREMTPDTLPKSMAEALKTDDLERERLSHSEAVAVPGGAPRPGVYSSHGAPEMEDHQNRQVRYYQKIDKALSDFLAGQNTPLVLGGDKSATPIYRTVNSYNKLLPEGIDGSLEHVPLEELHRKSMLVMEPHLREEELRAKERFADLSCSPNTSIDIQEVVAGAHHGRVDTLFVPVNEEVWGTFDSDSAQVEVNDGDSKGCEDLLNLSAMATIANGGAVFVLSPDDLPAKSSIAAILRY